jgi:hypothetical protein
MKSTRQNMYGREFEILEGDGLAGLCEGAIEAGGGALATNTAMMCRPFCASGAGNPIISAHRTPIPGFQWDEVWFGFQGFTSEEDFLRQHGFFGSGRCYIAVKDGGKKKLAALEDFVNLCPDAMLGPKLKSLGHGMFRYSKFFINKSRLPHHTHDCKDEAYWIEPAMVVDYELYDEQCFMALGLNENFGPEQLRDYLTRAAWDDATRSIKHHARWVYMHPGMSMIMKTQNLHGPAALLPHYEPQFLDDGYRMYEPLPKIPRTLLVGREIPKRLQVADVEADAQADREEMLDYLVSDEALDWDSIHDPRYAEKHCCPPVRDGETSDGTDVTDHWVVYGAFGRDNNHQVLASKRLVIQPGVKYTMQDPVGSDLIIVQGMGKVGTHQACAPRALKPGDLGNWCFIIPAETAGQVVIENTGDTELVALRTFGPDHPTMPVLAWQDRSKLIPKPLPAHLVKQ